MELEDAGLKEPSYIGFGNWRESTLSDWQRTWIDKQWSILGLVALLLATTATMLFQPALARSPVARSLVFTQGTPPRWRVAGQLAGAWTLALMTWTAFSGFNHL